MGMTAPSQLTSAAKKVIELALREALQLGHDYLGSEHLLLAVLKVAESPDASNVITANVLHRLGATYDAVRADVLAEIEANRVEIIDVEDPRNVTVTQVADQLATALANASKLAQLLSSTMTNGNGHKESE
jgi:ATP-dependent Clp protease ATP-binding subunit ClpC